MNCRIAEGMVNKYINHTLSVNDLEEFLEHIENCSSCYDELATYFIVHKAMEQLDEKQEDSVLDFRELLEEDIRKSITVYYRKFRKREILLRISEHHRTGRNASGQALLCDRTGAVYHADTEDAGGDEPGKRNPEYRYIKF